MLTEELGRHRRTRRFGNPRNRTLVSGSSKHVSFIKKIFRPRVNMSPGSGSSGKKKALIKWNGSGKRGAQRNFPLTQAGMSTLTPVMTGKIRNGAGLCNKLAPAFFSNSRRRLLEKKLAGNATSFHVVVDFCVCSRRSYLVVFSRLQCSIWRHLILRDWLLRQKTYIWIVRVEMINVFIIRILIFKKYDLIFFFNFSLKF